MDQDDNKKPHRKKQAGAKLNKKAKKNVETKNPKAFTFNSIKKTERAVRRAADVKERKFHQPLVDRTSVVPPPVVVAVVGPPKVGKSTLITCLIRNFVKKKVSTINGPITIVNSKKQRLTFIECNNDINCMIDVAKIADLVLLMVDASFGFEMEIFEFLHIAKSHGEMKVLGVLTHLDSFNQNKKLKKTKKILKDRFWKDVYPGAKLFYLSGIINGSYMKSEVKNLGRFISVIKYRPLLWRSSHPYVLVDRMEDVTDPEEVRRNGKVDRRVCFYGYVRGTHFKDKCVVHIPGVGDQCVSEVSALEDPCPLPEQLKKRSLNEQERLLYAPMCEVGGVMVDQDAIYINTVLNQAFNNNQNRSDGVAELMKSMRSVQGNLEEKLHNAHLQVFSKGDEEEEEEEEDEDGNMEGSGDEENAEDMDVDEKNEEKPWGRMSYGSGDEEDQEDDEEDQEDDEEDQEDDEEDEEADDDDGDGDYEDENMDEGDDEANSGDEKEMDGQGRWKSNLREKGIRGFLHRLHKHHSMQHVIYGDTKKRLQEDREEEEEEEENVFGFLKSVKKAESGFKTSRKHAEYSMQSNVKNCDEKDVLEEVERVRTMFTAGEWNDDEDAAKVLQRDDANRKQNEEQEDDDNDDFSDDDDDDDDDEGEGGSENEDEDEAEKRRKETPEERRERRMKAKLLVRKARQRELFEAINGVDSGEKTLFEQQKEEMAKLAELNRSEFDSVSEAQRVAFEGYRPGTYIRVQVDAFPCEFVRNFDASYPVVLGGLLASEQNIGLVTVTMKVHRWYKRILKSGDPLVLSIGWRRFQTLPTFSIPDHNGRNRFCKYTPPHFHCQATFWGPITPDKTGVVAVQTLSSETKEFRLAGMGVVSQSDNAISIVKKLKLIGHPFLIHRNTAFIKDMFNSELEVAKFSNACLRTVSGIRGQVKKSVKEASTILKKHKIDTSVPPGSFRATFEDKILMKDIVFMRTWCRSTIPQFYNPVVNLLLPCKDRDAWRGMRTAGEVRRERNLRRTPQEDSLYKPIERKQKEAAPLSIPRSLQKELPFKLKPKAQARIVDSVKRLAVVKDAKERKVSEMMKRLQDLYTAKRKEKRVEMRQRALKHQSMKKKMEMKKKQKRS